MRYKDFDSGVRCVRGCNESCHVLLEQSVHETANKGLETLLHEVYHKDPLLIGCF
jgi:hypothetical protein